MTSMMPLVVEKAQVRCRGKVLIGPVNFTLQTSGLTVVMGPNGSGKTSLLRMLHGVVRLADGTVSWTCDKTSARAKQAFVFQNPIMLRRSVRDNLTFPLRILNVPRKTANAEAERWAARIGLEQALTRSAAVLSGGEKQKVAIARALLNDPEIIIADEPTGNLDPKSSLEIMEVLSEINSNGNTILMATHDFSLLKKYKGRILRCKDGLVDEIDSDNLEIEKIYS